MAYGMTGAGGSWGSSEEEEKKKKERERASKGFSGSALGIQGLGATVDQAMPQLRAKEQRYPISQDAKNRMGNQLSSMGINVSNPLVPGTKSDEPQWNPKDYPSVYAGKAVQPQPTASVDPIADSYVEPTQKIGFNPVAQQRSIAANTGGFNMRMPNEPIRSSKQDAQRDALIRQASTVQKGAKGITAAQMNVLAGLTGDDDKLANDRFTSKLGAASQLAQTQINQGAANVRAQMSEAGSNDRFNSQLGFDAAKFQQSTDQQQQINSLAERRLGIEQENSSIANFAPKQLNALYEKYELAQSDEDKSAIATQIQALKGNASQDKYVAVSAGERVIDPQTGATEKLPDVFMNTSDGTIVRQPEVERTPNDPELVTIAQSGKFSKAELATIYDTYMAGGDISSYLQ